MESNAKVVVTEYKIQKAFIKEVKKVGFDKLTVNQLVKESHLNRGTFYLHYQDKFDLKSHYENQIIAEIQNIFLNYQKPGINKSEEANDAFFELFAYLYKHREITGLLMNSYDSPLVLKVKKMIPLVVSKEMNSQGIISRDYAQELYSQGVVDFIFYWLNHSPVRKPADAYAIFLGTRKLSPIDLAKMF